MKIQEACARAAHEVNRVYCMAAGDHSQFPWEHVPEWQRESALRGVEGALAGATPEESHASWLADKRAAGWTYGEVKNTEEKRHPCMLPYDRLPPHQRAKDALYLAVVRAVAVACDGKYEREGFKKQEFNASQVTHADHGRGSAESGPDDPSCPCREEAAACARAGCGFCGTLVTITGIGAS